MAIDAKAFATGNEMIRNGEIDMATMDLAIGVLLGAGMPFAAGTLAGLVREYRAHDVLGNRIEPSVIEALLKEGRDQ